MRPWIHIPLFIFLITLLLAGWVLMREVPVERQGTAPVLAAEMASPFASAATLTPTGILEGFLLDAQGIPQPLADISTLQDGRILWTHTDENGHFQLDGLQDGPLEVSVLAPNRLPEILAVPGPRSKFRLSLKRQATPAPILSEPQKSTWRGRMRNPRKATDLEGFEVWLNPTGPAQEVLSGIPRRILTNDEGRFEILDLLHAEYSVHLLPPGSKGGMGPNLLVPMGTPANTLKHDGTPITAELISLGGGLEGTVLGPAGNPISAAMVMLTALTRGQGDGAIDKVLPAMLTDHAGKWSVENLKPGPYRIRVRGGGLASETVIDLDASQAQTVDFTD